MVDAAIGQSAVKPTAPLGAIDALRGYAILLVIGAHSLRHVPTLVWPARRVLLLGVYGVQLFFLASALTLMMSWSRSRAPWPRRSRDFLIHRLFRIAPLYFLAIPFYWLVEGQQADQFSAPVLSATLLFYNAWSPYFIRTVPGWTPVPGGWSIGVEFCFYLLFPALAWLVTSLRRGAALVAVALVLMLVAGSVGAGLYPALSDEQRANFLYFWPPNHLIDFALGFVLYFCVVSEKVRAAVSRSRIDSVGATALLLLAYIGLSFVGMRKSFDWSTWAPPTHLLMTLCFLPWALVLVLKPHRWIVNRAIVAIGQVSFSVYILHFAMLGLCAQLLAAAWPFATTGLSSLAVEAALLALAGASTFLVARLSYRWIEQPCIAFGRALCADKGRSGAMLAPR